MSEQQEINLLKRELEKSISFKTVFNATLGFYAGQTIAMLLGLLTFAAISLAMYAVVHFLK